MSAIEGTPSQESRVHMIAAMLGVAVAFAMDDLAKHEPFQVAHLAALVAFVITAVVFTLAMMDVVRSRDYWAYLAQHRARAVYDLFSDVAMGLILVFMALHLREAGPLLASNLALRFADVGVELIVVRPARRNGAILGAWLLIDAIALVVLGVTLLGYFCRSWGALEVSLAFLSFTVIGTVIDLAANGNLYFSSAAPTTPPPSGVHR